MNGIEIIFSIPEKYNNSKFKRKLKYIYTGAIAIIIHAYKGIMYNLII